MNAIIKVQNIDLVPSRRSALVSHMLASFAGFLLAGCSGAHAATGTTSADLVLINGRILTVDPNDSIAAAIAVKAGKITAVGSTADVRRLIGDATKVIDLNGRTATPGLIDTHIHMANVAQLGYEYPPVPEDCRAPQCRPRLFWIDLEGATINADNVLRLLQERVRTLQPGDWILGNGWDARKLERGRKITVADLDSVAPNNPVWLRTFFSTSGVANSYALKLAGITQQTPQMPGSVIGHDEKGNLTGALEGERAAKMMSLVPTLTREQEKAGILQMIQNLHREGMTAAKDPWITPSTWESYRELLSEGKLNLHVFALLFGGYTVKEAQETLKFLQPLPRPPASLGNGRLLAGVKLVFDEPPWMYEDLNKDSTGVDKGNRGQWTIEPEEYRRMVRLFHNAGIHIGTHTLGDRATDWVVDTYARVLKEKPTHGLRHAVIHALIPTDHATDEMARLERDYDAGYPEANPAFMWWLSDDFAGMLGPQRSLRVLPLKTWQAKGIHWASGSDWFITPIPARYGLWASVARHPLNQTYGIAPFGTAEAVDARTALRSYTIWAAHQLFLEDRVGSLEVGKDADIAVWDRDPYTVPTDFLEDMKCELTVFAGTVVYRASPDMW